MTTLLGDAVRMTAVCLSPDSQWTFILNASKNKFNVVFKKLGKPARLERIEYVKRGW
jgi:hypothetical protein